MRNARFSVLVFTVGLAALVSMPMRARASCGPPSSLGAAIATAPAAFVGTVTRVDNGGKVAAVHVDDVWKGGGVATEVQVVGSPDITAAATSADRTYTVDQQYLFIPSAGSGNTFDDNSCTLTQPYAPALASLRPVGAPGIPTVVADTSARSWLVGAMGGLVVLVALMGFLVVLVRRRSANP